MGKIHAVSTQGLIMAILLSVAAGFGIGQYVKTGKRISKPPSGSVGGGDTLTS